jgi:hypothetical protein
MKAFIKGAESCMKLEKYKDAQTWCSTGLTVSFSSILINLSFSYFKIIRFSLTKFFFLLNVF